MRTAHLRVVKCQRCALLWWMLPDSLWLSELIVEGRKLQTGIASGK